MYMWQSDDKQLLLGSIARVMFYVRNQSYLCKPIQCKSIYLSGNRYPVFTDRDLAWPERCDNLPTKLLRIHHSKYGYLTWVLHFRLRQVLNRFGWVSQLSNCTALSDHREVMVRDALNFDARFPSKECHTLCSSLVFLSKWLNVVERRRHLSVRKWKARFYGCESKSIVQSVQ